MIYLDGTVWLMSPSFPHERLKKRLGHVRRWRSSSASTSPASPPARRPSAAGPRRGGVEGDQTYYLANEERIRGKDKIDLQDRPTPDLAIEAVHSHDAEAAIEVYRRLRVPEVWICDEAELVILVLQPNGQYARVDDQRGLPVPLGGRDLRVGQAAPDRCPRPNGSSELRRWVQRTLKPRVRRQAGNAG